MTSGSDEMSSQDLILHFLPRPIVTEADYEATQREIDRLLDRGELTPDETKYLHLLGTLVMVYEAQTEGPADYDLRGVTLIKGLLKLHRL